VTPDRSLALAASVPDRGLDAALEVRAGETLALLGPNGAGKSTLLSLVAGLLRPHDGHVTLGGRVLTSVQDGTTRTWVAPHRRRVGLLDQRPLLFPHLSVADNVAFGPRSTGVRRAEAHATALRWLAAVGLEDRADTRATALSGGQAQRVAVARALAAAPDLLLLDEPLAALDVDVAPALRHRLREVLADQTAVIATHDVLDALLLADRVAVVEDGRVVEEGPTPAAPSRPASPGSTWSAAPGGATGSSPTTAWRCTGSPTATRRRTPRPRQRSSGPPPSRSGCATWRARRATTSRSR
jgi:molybdate transport system ATP-binding protein